MKHVAVRALALLICLAGLAALAITPLSAGVARLTPPLVAGLSRSTERPARRSFSKEELQQILQWLNDHQSAWSMMVATPPIPIMVASLTDSAARTIEIDFYNNNESWKHAVGLRIYDPKGAFTYGGDMTLSTIDMSALQKLLKFPK